MNKEALGGDLGKLFTYIIPFVVASNLAGYYIPKGLAKMEKANRRKHVGEKWVKLISRYPQMTQDPKNRDTFEALAMLYPHLADHPETIVSALRIAQDYATEGIDPNTLKTLSDTEKAIANSINEQITSGKDLFSISKALSDVNKDAPDATSPSTFSWGMV